jgi:hypothetical protein
MHVNEFILHILQLIILNFRDVSLVKIIYNQLYIRHLIVKMNYI